MKTLNFTKASILCFFLMIVSLWIPELYQLSETWATIFTVTALTFCVFSLTAFYIFTRGWFDTGELKSFFLLVFGSIINTVVGCAVTFDSIPKKILVLSIFILHLIATIVIVLSKFWPKEEYDLE